MAIKPQDHRPDVELKVMIPAALLARLIAYADNLKDGEGRASTIAYIIFAILDKELPQIKEPKTPKAKAQRAGA